MLKTVKSFYGPLGIALDSKYVMILSITPSVRKRPCSATSCVRVSDKNCLNSPDLLATSSGISCDLPAVLPQSCLPVRGFPPGPPQIDACDRCCSVFFGVNR
jgi:hypothetical protein